ncbi:MAG: pantothenate kinase [Cyanobacteria bacterium]|nr:pantothenate kinase [Cyanobacteria bacterium CG_2015-16_32_12]NCO78760.1 pantothenate kinase [Cyanobacteria bacterium CG_2015-22_32_23]NCQ05255.1 pantothenate kinase [Cyanobacteria bacterium CG_2015-09_32_10]NCQ42073.1 pantothenate kinase [Cyanobacteria bacterium CG_2015-04_32_10]NCS85548.1 pantothenate kinase [Cyanobacteria bacterium CG_2015-02_32_10]
MQSWLGLIIGNSRLHWCYCDGEKIQQTWNTSQAESLAELSHILDKTLYSHLKAQIPLYIASVVPSATKIYLSLPQTTIINGKTIPLQDIYPTMGVDRILALWGAGCNYGFPCLVIDSGTALTFTGADENKKLIGGAILPGVRLQLQTLFFNTAALPEIEMISEITPRWAKNTSSAIQSGIIYTVIASLRDFSEDWLQKYPQSQVILTGGDALLLNQYLEEIFPDINKQIKVDTNLIFLGIKEYINITS